METFPKTAKPFVPGSITPRARLADGIRSLERFRPITTDYTQRSSPGAPVAVPHPKLKGEVERWLVRPTADALAGQLEATLFMNPG